MTRHNVWANAQPLVSDAEIEALRGMTSAEVEAIAQSQIKKAWDAYDRATEIKEWQGPISAWVQYRRFKEVIANAEMNLQNGKKENDDNRKKELYIISWRTAKIAASNIAEEAKLNPTLYHAWARPAIEYVDDKFKEAKQGIDKANNLVIVTGVIAAIFFLYQQSQKK
jgi:hypothetical protein